MTIPQPEEYGLRNTFEGRYFKHQKGNTSIAFIPGRCKDAAFIQVITNNQSCFFSYPLSEYQNTGAIHIGGNVFSDQGIHVDINQDGARITADVEYGPLTPIRSDIMGPFRFIPMQCRHGILSMRHDLSGSVRMNDQTFDFTEGVGYMEEDSGRSFPNAYLWLHCVNQDCSVMLSIADIPFCGFHFRGCLCAIYYMGREYRLATYLGVRTQCTQDTIVLRQGKLRLEARISAPDGQSLFAPRKGKMNRIIKECILCYVFISFYENNRVVFKIEQGPTSFERVNFEQLL